MKAKPRSISFVLIFFLLFFNRLTFAQILEERQSPDHVAVVVPAEFRAALQPWLEYRNGQGYKLHLIEPRERTGVEEIRTALRELTKKHPVRAVLLVGDAPVEANQIFSVANNTSFSKNPHVPVPYVLAKVVGEFGPHQRIASDNVYADLDGDELPDIAVGRFSVKTPTELTAIVHKTIRFEKERKPQILASRRINLVAGVGGFSPLLDRTIESSARYILSRTIPAEYEITLTQASVGSPYCPAPNQFRYETIARLNEGPLFWVYMGHGTTQSLDFLHLPPTVLPQEYSPEAERNVRSSRRLPIFAPGDSQYVSCQQGLPIAIFLACLTGELDARHDCLAEELHRLEHGPVAVFASSRTSMPYGMSVLGIELIDEIFQRRLQSGPMLLGDAILNAKRRSILENGSISKHPVSSFRERSVRDVIDSLAKVFDPTGDRLDQQRLDHIHLFHLFGDPLLRLPTPLNVELDAPLTAKPDSVITIRGKINRGNVHMDKNHHAQETAIVELSIPKSRSTVTAPKDRTFRWTQQSVDEFNTLYRKSNSNIVFRTAIKIEEHSPNEFEVQLHIPKFQRGEKGEYDLCVYWESETAFGLGSRSLQIK